MRLRIPHLDVDPQSALHALQAIAIIIGACWILFRYMSHERDLQTIALEQNRLAYQQASAVAQIQQQAEDARLRQLQLSNEQAAVALSTQRDAQKLALEQQRLANEQARLTLQINETQLNETQRRLRQEELEKALLLEQQDLDLKRLQQTKAQHELAHSTRYRFTRQFTITARKDRDIDQDFGDFSVDWGYEFVNKSEVLFELSVFLLDYYIGITQLDTTAHVVSVWPVGFPTDRWNPSGNIDGAIAWKRVGSNGSIYAEAIREIQPPWDWIIRQVKLSHGGGTGVLKSEQTMRYDDTYLVRAPRTAYFAIVMSYCFNRCANNDDLYSRVDWIALTEATTPNTEPQPSANLKQPGGKPPDRHHSRRPVGKVRE